MAVRWGAGEVANNESSFQVDFHPFAQALAEMVAVESLKVVLGSCNPGFLTATAAFGGSCRTLAIQETQYFFFAGGGGASEKAMQDEEDMKSLH